MRGPIPSLLLLSIWASISATQSFNVTVNHNDTSQITYGGNAAEASICIVDDNGLIIGEQAGCYNVPSQCTTTAAMAQSPLGFASWKFKGSALYITSLLSSTSPEFSITIDGNSMDADGARPGMLPFDCFTLFSTAGLDPNVEHSVNMTIKGPSPNRNMSFPVSTVFSLVNYTYTTDDATNVSSTNSIGGPSASPSPTGADSAAFESIALGPIHFALTFMAGLVMVV